MKMLHLLSAEYYTFHDSRLHSQNQYKNYGYAATPAYKLSSLQNPIDSVTAVIFPALPGMQPILAVFSTLYGCH